MSATIKKQITISTALFARVQEKADELGVSFAEYLRYLMISDFKKEKKINQNKSWDESLPVYIATEKESESIISAKKEEGILMTAEEFKNRRHYV